MIENKVLKFELSPRNLKVKKLLNQDFLVIEMKAISSVNPNRNGSYFTKESMEDAIPTFYNKPILSSFSVTSDDFRGHEGDLKYDPELDQLYYDYTDAKSETPLGMIRSEDIVELVYDEIDGLYWIKFSCALWVKYGYKQIKRLLKSRTGDKKISVEIEVKESYVDDKGVEVITKFVFDGVTILSDKLETGIADAKLTILDKISDTVFQKKQKCLAYAYNNLEKTDNTLSSNNDVVVNENVEEISMNQEGGDEKMLTYGQKREILESYLRGLIQTAEEDGCCCLIWVYDLDEQNVYFELEGNVYRAEYSIETEEDGSRSVNVDLENKEQVIRSWTKFEANVDEFGNVIEHEEHSSEDEPEDEPEDEGFEKQDISKFEISIGEEKLSVDEFVQKYNEVFESHKNISEQYDALKIQYSSVEESLNKYKEAEKKENIKSMINFAQSIVNAEDGLDDSERLSLNNQIKENCEQEKFASQEDAKTFTISSIAVTLYTKKLNGESKVQKEFSIPFSSVNNILEDVDTDSGIKKLQKLNKKLEKI